MNWKPIRIWEIISSELLAAGAGLGVYLDRHALTLAQVQKTLSGIEVKDIITLSLPEGGLEPLVFPLQEIISRWGLQNSPVSLAVSRNLGFLRPMTLPQAAGENLAQVVAYELDRFLPLPADRLYFAFQTVEETKTEIHLMLMALPREPVEACLNCLAQAGLQPVSLELAPVAAANVFARLAGRLPSSWLLLYPGEDGVLELGHIQGRTLRSWRTLPLKTGAALRAEIEKICAQAPAPEALGYYGEGIPGADLARLSSKLGIVLITPEHLNLKGLPAEKPLQSAGLPALGAAFRTLGRVPLGANLLPEAEQAQIKLTGFFLIRSLLVLCLSLSCLWIGSLLIHRRVALYQVNRALASLAPEARQVEGQLKESQALAGQMQNFRKRLEQSPNKLRVLKELTQLIPDNTWVFNLRLSQNLLEISGVSTSAGDLIPLLERSGWLTKTEFASPIVTDASKLEHFKIKAEVKGMELGS
jgi:general secretion pathway protein L